MEKKLHRLFVAVDFPSEVIEEVARVQEVLRSGVKFTGKLTELENLHLTLKFLGEIDDEKLEKVREMLKEARFDGFDAKLESVGTFNFRGNPRIVWIKVSGKGIFELQSAVDLALSEIGFVAEKRFMSHMTIARVKYVKDKNGFVSYVDGIKLREVRFKIREFKLKESELKGIGPVYSDVEVYGMSDLLQKSLNK